MDQKLLEALVKETTLEDISDSYRPIVDIVGVQAFVELGHYARGDELYIPIPDTIVAPARNRRIKREYNGRNARELAIKYDMTIKQVYNILKDAPIPEQMELDFT